MRALLAAVLALGTLAAGVDPKSSVQAFGDWQLIVFEDSGGTPHAYLAHQPAPGANIEIDCGGTVYVGLRTPAKDVDSLQSSVLVTYTIGQDLNPVSETWQTGRTHVTTGTPTVLAYTSRAGVMIARMRGASGRLNIEVLGQRLSPSLDDFAAAMSALDPYCARRG